MSNLVAKSKVELALETVLEHLTGLEKKGSEIFLKPEADEALQQYLIFTNEVLPKFDKDFRELLKNKALELDKDFKSIRGDNAQINYSYSGARYELDKEALADLSDKEIKAYLKKGILKEKTTISLAPKVVEEIEGEFPSFIKTKERTKNIVIKVPNKRSAKLEDEDNE